MTLAQAAATGTRTEVDFTGTVTSMPRTWHSASGYHEHFRVQSDDGPSVEIADNVSIAPPVPVKPGDRVTIRGEFVQAYNGGGPLVHWTHHDPSHRHPDGFIGLDGRLYA